MRNPILILAVLMFATGLAAADKKLVHCFYFTVVDSATPADWDAFAKATEALPGKVPGLLHAWQGKLARPLALFNVDAEARKKLTAGEKSAPATATRAVRQHGACMVFADEAALKAYAPHPAHKEWEAVYSKVRVAGTTTLDFQ
ncbi:MAG: Dabb family protein [Acidobacteria bacterium]|nr:Dabb family protein [Acidobacteriota bacterium]